jgi:hypothetical protein
MSTVRIVPSCDPLTALRRIAQHSREHLLPELRGWRHVDDQVDRMLKFLDAYGLRWRLRQKIRFVLLALRTGRTGVLVPEFVVTSDYYPNPHVREEPLSAEAHPRYAALFARRSVAGGKGRYVCTPYAVFQVDWGLWGRPPDVTIANLLQELGKSITPAEARQAGAQVWEAALPSLASAAVGLTLEEPQP